MDHHHRHQRPYTGKSLSQLLLSWTLKDLLDNDLYKDWVRIIPKTFSSLPNYFNSFIYPLIEETRADLCSSLKSVFSAPTCQLLSIHPSKDYKPPNDLFYTIEVKHADNVDVYEPEIGDVIVLTSVKPKCIDHLDMHDGSYTVAIVQRVSNRWRDDNYDEILILVSKDIQLKEEMMMMRETGMGSTRYATFLINMITNIRIWKSLNSELETANVNILRKVSQMDSAASENCPQCYHLEKHRIDVSSLGAIIRSFDLNDSQREAVITCLAAQDCRHQNLVKLIWGPPGTGKTSTVATLLFALLNRKCRTLTCAPTNIAVLEVATRVLRLIKNSLEYGTYGIGDVVLFGNRERMKIDERDDLLDTFLDYRVDILSKCFAPLSGWKHYLNSMILLLEDPEVQYHDYTRNPKDVSRQDMDIQCEKKNVGRTMENDLRSNEGNKPAHTRDSDNRTYGVWKSIIDHTLQESKRNWKEDFQRQKKNQRTANKEVDNDDMEDFETGKLEFQEFLKLRFGFIKKKIEMYTLNLLTHLPTKSISLQIAKKMLDSVNLLEDLSLLLHFAAATSGGLKQAFGVSPSDSKLVIVRNQCLEMLRSLHDRFTLPNFFDKRSVRNYCLKNARLLFCTASTSAKLHSEEIAWVEMLIIDEAAQLKECESTIPLQLPGLRHVILIGDECQLPAMIKSKLSVKAQLGRSLFERLASVGHKKHLLDVQYRMHPSISLFPNTEFYNKLIVDAPNVKGKSYEKHFLRGECFSPYSFINVSYGEDESDDGHSHKNVVEVAVVSEIVAKLFEVSAANKQGPSVGIISPYNAQVSAIKEKLGKTYMSSADNGFSVTVRSIDGFQGGEEDIIIISTVRSNLMGTVGFLYNPHRTNVALTRARYCLWIVGNGATLINSDTVWGRLVIDAKSRGCFYNADMDERLGQAMMDSLIELDQLDFLLRADSLLFKSARWKVYFDDGFLKSMRSIKNMEVRKQVLSLIRMLSNGWRQHDTKRDFSGRNWTSEYFEYYKINEELRLIWSVDILEENSNYIQILKVWNVLPLYDLPKLAKQLEIFYAKYPTDIMNCCKFRSIEGDMEVPMAFPVGPTDNPKCDPVETLSEKFASLSLRDESEASTTGYNHAIWSKVPRMSAH
ncbi:hypothetical protein ACFE04_006946 [Oxalis oulophora]